MEHLNSKHREGKKRKMANLVAELIAFQLLPESLPPADEARLSDVESLLASMVVCMCDNDDDERSSSLRVFVLCACFEEKGKIFRFRD